MKPRRPKKHWGQNFLVNDRIAEEIVAHMDCRPDDFFLEIGSGTGALTRHLLASGGRVVCVEIDPGLCTDLEGSLQKEKPGLVIVNRDILGCRLSEFGADRVRIATNAPYYISSSLLNLFLAQIESIDDIHIMLQLEVCDTLLAEPGCKEYGRMTVMMSLAYDIERLMDVPRAFFRPEPKVDSGVLRMVPSDRLDGRLHPMLNRILSAAFGGRRKKLRNSLAVLRGGEVMERTGFDLDRRAEEVPPGEYLGLAKEMVVRADKGQPGL